MQGAVKNAENSRAPTLCGIPCNIIFATLALGLCWLLFFSAVQVEWRINQQYNYGYVVPLLGLVLIWCRWPDRPPALAHTKAWTGCLAGFLLFLWLPWDLLIQANPEWRLLYWSAGVQVVAMSLCLAYWIGGRKWVSHFSVPLIFMLIATPWPMQFEQFLVQGLMRFVAGLTVNLAGFLNIPAVQHGNLIEVKSGIVGIDEACSGVRSFQSALMLSLFLGELNRFSPMRRLALFASSILFVLFANASRTTFLVWAAATRGLQQMQAWHDTAGLIVMIIVLAGLLLLAHYMRPRTQQKPAAPAVASLPQRLAMPPLWFSISAIIWLGVAAISTELWYRAHERNLVSNQRWSVVWPLSSSEFKKTTVPEGSLAILRCSDSDAASWQDDSGNSWSGFLLRWRPGRNSAQLAKGHRPDICFPAAGAQLLEDHGIITVPVGGLRLPFRYQTFNTGQTVAHVFYCLWSDHRSPVDADDEDTGATSGRLRAALAGERNLGQQVLEIVIRNTDSESEARQLFNQMLPTLIHVDGDGASS